MGIGLPRPAGVAIGRRSGAREPRPGAATGYSPPGGVTFTVFGSRTPGRRISCSGSGLASFSNASSRTGFRLRADS